MPTALKAKTIDELTEQLSNANLVVLTDYRGLNVTDLQGLRASLRSFDGEFRIAKNTLTRIAAERAGIEGLEPALEGPLAIGFANGDIVGFAKAMNDFVRTSRILTIKGGVLDKRFINSTQVEGIASLASKETLQAQLLGMLKAPQRNLVSVLNGPSRSVAYVLNARAEQLGGVAAD
ncbi:MAG: 50S ribosomal protein L10 [Thermomicrobiales bacterium]|jgi:large subunit ribosomal protein L10|nr:50S ribosomal protein L10 [Thermomicrobiales bacterium]